MRIMLQTVFISAFVLIYATAIAQTGLDEPVFHSTSTMVTVPALVRGQSGEFVTTLRADDFALYDNGTRQSVKLASTNSQPMALVLVMQTGGIASRHFFDYVDLPAFLDWLTAGTNHELMLVTFDSRVQIIWHFPLRSDGVAHSLTNLRAGDRGAAMADAVQFAVEQLQSEPGEFRRIVLLVSQEKDEGSTVPDEDTLRTLGKGSTSIYSLTFAPPTDMRKTSRNRHPTVHTSPLAETVDKLREGTASEVAAYTGGAHMRFSTRPEFDEDIKAIAADIRNRSSLTFQPKGHEPGLHLLTVKVSDGRSVTARGGYWFDPVRSDP